MWETQKGGVYKNARRSDDVRPTNLSTSFIHEKKRKEEMRGWGKKGSRIYVRKERSKNRESATALTLPRETDARQ